MGGQNPHQIETIHHSDNNLEVQNPHDSSGTSKTDAWKVSLIGGACACIAVFVINLGVTVWSSVGLKDSQNGMTTSRRIIYEGSCSTSRTLSVVIHLIINIFGSILLAASNYGMQCLSAPTRKDVDKAHASQKWVDIGIPSIHNLGKVSKWRVLLWSLLLLSSVPLHLLFNSVVYSSLTTWEYNIFAVDPELRLLKPQVNQNWGANPTPILKEATAGTLDNLTALECINEYAVAFQTKRSGLLLVVDPSTPESELKFTRDFHPSLSHNVRREFCASSYYDWICPKFDCSNPCRSQLPQVRSQSDDWRPFGKRVKYCLSQRAPQRCKLNFNFQIAVTILGANIIKAAILVLIVLRPPKEPLFVLGDAIQSFLTSPDERSRGSCLASAIIVRVHQFDRPRTMNTKHRHRGAAVTKRRWILSLILYATALGITCFLLAWGIKQLSGPHDIRSLWNLGFGTATELTLIMGDGWNSSGEKALVWNVLISNSPQLIFSFLYFQYNGIYTGMAAAKEWSDLGHRRRSLRVSSNPRGEQRSRYFLQLPYRYSIPLLVVSILMHWILSQSIFVVAVEEYGRFGNLYWKDSNCGYSPVAIIFAVITAVLMAAAVIISALRRLPTAIPVAGSCSLAIAAACHHPDGVQQPDASLLPLQWGVMWRQRQESGWELTDHCGFSEHPVEKPQDGVVYR